MIGIFVGIPNGLKNRQAHARNKGGGFFNGLDLDFVRGRYALNGPYSAAFPTGWSFSRTGAGTAETSGGVIVPFGTGVPRITSRGLLVEEARTNLVPRSNDLTNAAWVKAASTATLVAGAPDGGNASRLTATAAFACAAQAAFAVTAGLAYTMTAYVRAVTVPSVTIVFEGVDHGGNSVSLNYVFSGAIVSGTGSGFTSIVRSASPLSNGWVRLQLTFTVPAGVTTLRPRLWLGPYNPDNQAGLAADFWGAQLEAGSFPTSPIITTGATATRGADLPRVILPVGLLTTAATMLVDVEWPNATNPTATAQCLSTLSDGSINNRLQTFRTGADVASRVSISGLSYHPGNVTGGAGLGVRRYGLAVEPGRSVAAVGGALSTAGSPSGALVLTQLDIGLRFDQQEAANAYIRRVRILPYAAADAELQALTT